jgi:hypothetical protein
MSFERRDNRHGYSAPAELAVTLRYPLPWCQTDVGTAPRTLATRGWRGLGVARFGTWPLAGDPQRAATGLRFLACWLLIGDDAEADVLAAIRGDDSPAELPAPLPALWEIARRYRATMGPAFCARLADSFADWLAAARCDARWSTKLRAGGLYPTRDDVLPVRAAAVGVAPALDLLEYFADCPLPPAVRAHPALGAVRRYAARLVAIQDDLSGAALDLAEARPNLIGCLLRAEGFSLRGAAEEIEALHDESLCGLTGAAQLLRAEFPRCDALARWLRAVQSLCHGFAAWQARHDRPTPLPDRTSLSIEIEYV